MAKILIIEDDELLRGVLVEVLEKAGHVVTAAKDGRIGLKLIRKAPPDLVVTDIIMPDQDGIGVAMALRTEYPAIPLIAMSGGIKRSSLYLETAKQLGARRILEKPFTAETLLRAISDVGIANC